MSRRPFSGYWEYHIEDALFTAPARTDHSGAGLFNADGELVGVGSLVVGNASDGSGPALRGNMFVPVDLLKPILAELRSRGSSRNSSRAWLGLNCVEVGGQVHVVRLAADSPAEAAGVQPKDVIVADRRRPRRRPGVDVPHALARRAARSRRRPRDPAQRRDDAALGPRGRSHADVEPAAGRVSRAAAPLTHAPAGCRAAPSPLRSPPSEREGPAPLGPLSDQ